jgi:hypothetical protein
MSEHSLLSPSAAYQWISCPASIWKSKGIPDEESEYAAEGTLAHSWAEKILSRGEYSVINNVENRGMPYTMAIPIDTYLKALKSMTEGARGVAVEMKLDLSTVLGVEGSKGTADFVAMVGDELQVHDLKYGKGLKVEAKDNCQLMLYALGALHHPSYNNIKFEKVRLVIHQPRLYSVSEHVIGIEELNAFKQVARNAAKSVMELYNSDDEPKDCWYTPGEKVCKWCRAKGSCGSLSDFLLKAVVGEFDDLTELPEKVIEATKEIDTKEMPELGSLYSILELLKGWSDAVKNRVKSEMLAGNKVPGYKLVLGNKGIRKWENLDTAENTMKGSRLKLDEMYTKKIISPKQAEDLLKKRPKLWKKFINLIIQAEAVPTVVEQNHKKPEIVINPAAEFEDLTELKPDLTGGVTVSDEIDTSEFENQVEFNNSGNVEPSSELLFNSDVDTTHTQAIPEDFNIDDLL